MTYRPALVVVLISTQLAGLVATARGQAMVPVNDSGKLSPAEIAARGIVVVHVPARRQATNVRLSLDEFESMKYECVAPCTLRLPSGSYTAVIGGAERSEFAVQLPPRSEALELVYPKRGLRLAAISVLAIAATLAAVVVGGFVGWYVAWPPGTECAASASVAGFATTIPVAYGALSGLVAGGFLSLGARGGLRAAPKTSSDD
jgi:hypothetical protein